MHIKDSRIFQPLAHTTNIGKTWMISVQNRRPELFSTVKVFLWKTDQIFGQLHNFNNRDWTSYSHSTEYLNYFNAICWRCPYLKQLLNFINLQLTQNHQDMFDLVFFQRCSYFQNFSVFTCLCISWHLPRSKEVKTYCMTGSVSH